MPRISSKVCTTLVQLFFRHLADVLSVSQAGNRIGVGIFDRTARKSRPQSPARHKFQFVALY